MECKCLRLVTRRQSNGKSMMARERPNRPVRDVDLAVRRGESAPVYAERFGPWVPNQAKAMNTACKGMRIHR